MVAIIGMTAVLCSENRLWFLLALQGNTALTPPLLRLQALDGVDEPLVLLLVSLLPVELGSPLIIVDGRACIAQLLIGTPAILIASGLIGRSLDSDGVVLNGFLILSRVLIRLSAHGVGAQPGRIQLHCVGGISNGVLIGALYDANFCPTAVGRCIVGVQTQSFVVVLEGLLVGFQCIARLPAAVVHPHIGRVDTQRCRIVL